METLQKQTLLFTEEPLTLFPADSHANRTALQGKEKEMKITATSGRKCLERYERFPRHTLWGKTFLGYLVGTGDWFSMKCKLTWKMKGTKYNRLYFQLVAKMHTTNEKGYGLMPNPTCSETIATKEPREITWQGNSPRIHSNQGTNGQAKLIDLHMNGMLPTPTARDWKDGFKSQKKLNAQYIKRQSPSVALTVGYKLGTTSQLNPQFVAEMMGFPENWTELPFLSGETKV